MAHKIPVVDDEPEVLSLIKEYLDRLGYEVITARDGKQALALASRQEPHVILLDVVLPEIDGIEVCRRLKADEKTRFVPVILMTGFPGAAIEATMSAPDDILLKPIRLRELLVRVRSLIAVRHLTNRLERLLAYLEELDRNLSGER